MKQTIFVIHLAAAIIISGIILFIYASVQQVHRSMANDPQLQKARDICYAISHGKPYSGLFPSDTIEASISSAVFAVLYNEDGSPQQSSALLDGKLPQLPNGVIQFTKQNNEDVITWQPRSGVRLAMVVEKIPAPASGYIAVGRSLKETEERTQDLVNMMLITWASCMGVLLLHFLFMVWINRRNKA